MLQVSPVRLTIYINMQNMDLREIYWPMIYCGPAVFYNIDVAPTDTLTLMTINFQYNVQP